MNTTKLLSVLKKLEKKEQRSFLDLVKSPFFNKREELIRLGSYVVRHIDQSRSLKKRAVWTNVFPDRPFNDQQLRLYTSDLFKLLEEFLSVTHFRQDRPVFHHELLRAYRDRDMKKQFDATAGKARRNLARQSLRDFAFLRTAYAIELEHYQFLGEGRQMDDAPVKQLNRLLDQQFAYQKLKQSCVFLARNAILEEGNEPAVLEEILNLLQEHPEQMEHTGLIVYFHLYQLLKGPAGVRAFDQLLRLLRRKAGFFTKVETGDILRLLINWSIRQMNAGQTEFIRRTFELYQEGIEREYLLVRGRLSNFTYINIMFSGLKLQEFAWVEQFLEKYRAALEPAQSDNIYYFCLAHLRYEENRLDEAMKWLVRFDAKHDFFLYLSAQTTLIKIYYQLQELEPLESLLGSISVYLNRKRKIGYRKEAYKQMVRVCRKMIYLRPGDEERVAQLRLEAEQIPIPSFRLWLLSQLDA